MNQVLLDTSGYRYLIRRHPQLLEVIEAADKILMNAVVVGEVLCGFDRGAAPAKNRITFEHFLESKDVDVLPLDVGTAERYAVLFAYLQKKGEMVSPNDLWIAASAMQHGLRILTLDRDYLKIPHILVECFDPLI